MKIKARAKINLSLNVLGVDNGYHQLESVVTEIDLHDKIKAKKSREITVVYDNGFTLPPEQDNTYKACQLFKQTFNTGGVKIRVKKLIPLKAGLGGSSADAVGVVKAMQKLYKIPYSRMLKELLEKIGSDCPVQYAGGYNLMKGRGQIVEPIKADKKLYFVLICENNGVNTAECFALCDKTTSVSSNNQELINYLQNGGEMPKLYNALYLPATQINSTVKENYNILLKYFDRVNMSGSGSCVYGVTENKKRAKAIYKLLKNKGYNVTFTKS